MVAIATCLPTNSGVLYVLDRKRGLHQGARGGPLHVAQQFRRASGPRGGWFQNAIESVCRSGTNETLVDLATGIGTQFAGGAGGRRRRLPGASGSMAVATL